LGEEEHFEVDVSEIVEPDMAELEKLGEPVNLQPEMVAEEAAAAGSAGVAAVRVAMGQRGVTESGGPNRGVPYQRYVQYFGRAIPPSPWCAFFASWCCAQGGWRPRWANPGAVASVRQWGQAQGRFVSAPQHGDLFGLDSRHMGLVAGADPRAHQIWTVEGNYENKVTSRTINYAGAGLWFLRI
jgi:hypothetical protein